jgi:hypothetical protein
MTEAAIEKKTCGDAGAIGSSLKSCTVGIDNEGKEHVWHRGSNSVVVADEDGVEHRQYLGDQTLANWMTYVEQRRGWCRTGPFAAAARRADLQRKGARQ